MTVTERRQEFVAAVEHVEGTDVLDLVDLGVSANVAERVSYRRASW
jgi:hypothetical protein